MNDSTEVIFANNPQMPKLNRRDRYKKLIKDLFNLVSPYWRSEEKFVAWAMLLSVLTLNMLVIYMAVLLNKWNANFYNALEQLDKAHFPGLLFQFLGLVLLLIIFAVSSSFLGAYLAFKWRIWLTRQVMSDWLHNSTFCKLFTYKAKIENPDQRISQDIATFTSGSLNLSLSILTQFVKSITFAIILWSLSSSLSLILPGGIDLKIPGYMLWITILYVTFATYVIYRTGKPLVALDYFQEKVEADFRFSLMRIRERRDEISILDGAKAESKFLQQNILEVIKNYKQIIKRNIYINSFQNLFLNFTTILPILAASPMFFAGVITLGTLFQIANAFSQVESALMIFALNFQSFAAWKATFNRIVDFRTEMQELTPKMLAFGTELQWQPSENNKNLDICNLVLHLPQSRNLSKFDFQVQPFERVLLMGRSGLGKSTLLKCIAGQWPYASGIIKRPTDLTIIPQKPYFPISTLRNSLIYPNLDMQISDAQLQDVLSKCSLDHLKDRLNDIFDWNSVLSLGEQQRLNFARLIIAKPSWVILDEPTASMDKALEKHLFATLFKELPNTTILTIGHALSLKDFHSRCIEV